nr:N-alpha-acetyltransferase 35, NatC auxiliary subunit isoform X2 [Ipomoea trifida]
MADRSGYEIERGRNVELPVFPHTIPSGEQTVWADVSPLLQLACKDVVTDLGDGELVHGENFNLFAAMSALEIMDPKMDSGMVRSYYSVDEAIECGAAPLPLSVDKTIDVQCTIDIMDHLLACEEEDLFTMAHGLPLKVDGDDKCLTMLHAVEEMVSRQLRACKAPSVKKRLYTASFCLYSRLCFGPPQSNNPLGELVNLKQRSQHADDYISDFQLLLAWADSMKHYGQEKNRIKLQQSTPFKKLPTKVFFDGLLLNFQHFYHVLTNMKRPQGRGFELAKKHIASCLQEIDSMLKMEGFLSLNNAYEMPEDAIEDKTTASGCAPIGFDSTLNSRLSAPAPPRAIKILSWKKAIDYFRKLLNELDAICSHNLDPVFEGVLHFIVEFQKLQPELVARAHLQHLLIQDGKLYGRDPLFAVICKAALLPTAAKDHDIQKNETFSQLGQLLITLLRVLCTNLAWQRRKLGKILQDWRIIYVQLELAFRKEFGETSSNLSDENICMKIFKYILVWIEEQTYWIASRFLVLGFDLELYSTIKRKGKKKKDLMKDGAKDYPLPPVVLFLQCQIYIAEGLTMMLAALRNEQKIYQNVGPFNTEHERFMQHFELLQKACLPNHVSYFSFKEATAHACISTVSMYNFFKDAQRISKELRSSFSNDPVKMAELRSIEQVAEHNAVALNLISRLGTLDSSLKIYFEFSHHPYFATAIVKRS